MRQNVDLKVFWFVLIWPVWAAFLPMAWAQPKSFQEPLDKIETLDASHVIYFKVVESKKQQEHQQVQVEVHTRGGFRLYQKGLHVYDLLDTAKRNPLEVTISPTPKEVFDKFYKENRYVIEPLSRLNFNTKGDSPFVIQFEACSVNICLLPAYFKIEPLEGATSLAVQKNNWSLALGQSEAGLAETKTEFGSSKLPDSKETFTQFDSLNPSDPEPVLGSHGAQLPASPSVVPSHLATVGPAVTPPVTPVRGLALSDQVQYYVQSSLLAKSFWLFPALLLAGLAMNLTPCVYPMIPLTLNVMTQFGASKDLDSDALRRRRKLVPLFYFLGIVLSYSLLGVVAALTGSLFGGWLQLTWVNVMVGLFMILMGFTLLGAFQLSGLQALGQKVPLTQNHPQWNGFLMGGVSGLVSAPCTGPVLSALLLLIGQTQDPVYGFTLMVFFSSGFGLPYVFMGLFTDRLFRLPKLGRLLVGTKFLFASLMFGLSLNFLKKILIDIPLFNQIYETPNFAYFIILLLWMALGFALHAHKPWVNYVKQVCWVLPLSLLSLWLTLWATSGFTNRSTSNAGKPTSSLPQTPEVQWIKDYDFAKQKAWAESKPMLVDAWAQWCAACLKMDETTWKDPNVVQLLNQHFVAVKLDFTNESPELDKIIQLWKLAGLPAVGIYPVGSDLKAAPLWIYREAVEASSLLRDIKEKKLAPSRGDSLPSLP